MRMSLVKIKSRSTKAWSMAKMLLLLLFVLRKRIMKQLLTIEALDMMCCYMTGENSVS